MSHGREFSTSKMGMQASHRIHAEAWKKVICHKLRSDVQEMIKDPWERKGAEGIRGHLMTVTCIFCQAHDLRVCVTVRWKPKPMILEKPGYHGIDLLMVDILYLILESGSGG